MKKLLVSGALVLSLFLPPYSLGDTSKQDQKTQQLESLVIDDGIYDDHNAFVNEAEYSLEKILESVELIGCEVKYLVEYKDEDGNIVSKNMNFKAIGSGVVVEKKDGSAYLLTNYHVIGIEYPKEEGVNLKEISRKLYIFKGEDKNGVEAKNVAFDKDLDVAILEVKDSEDFKKFPYKIGDSDRLSPGDFVWVIGNPHGLEDYVLKGNVSKKDYPKDSNQFMIGCDIQSGYSGGVVVAVNDGKYELVGLVVATLIRQGSGEESVVDPLGGYGIAIKINPIMKLVNDYFNKKNTS